MLKSILGRSQSIEDPFK
jgi:hypothetical protein